MGLSELILRIDENQAKIAAYGKFDDAVLKKIEYRFRLDWNYYSNRMEGGTLTRAETRSVMIGNISIDKKPIKDVMEMNGHDKVVLDVLKIGKGELRLSEKRMKEIHKAIMSEEDPEKAKQIGEWKKEPNEIINYRDEKNSFSLPDDVPEQIHITLNRVNAQLDAFFANKKDKPHPLFIASDFHLDYIFIHPFYDGNGRTARIFTNLILIACGLPVIIIKDEHKDRYYKLLADILAYGGSKDLFYEYIAERIIDSQTIMLNALEGKEINEPDDLDKRIALLRNKFEKPTITERKSELSINNILSEVVLPLCKDIQAKCEKLNYFFLEHGHQIRTTTQRARGIIIKDKSQPLDIITIDYIKNKIQPELLQELEFEYMFNGLKNDIDGRSFYSNVIFTFNDFNYTIKTYTDTRDDALKKIYSDVLTAKEKNELVTKSVTHIIDEIERLSNSN